MPYTKQCNESNCTHNDKNKKYINTPEMLYLRRKSVLLSKSLTLQEIIIKFHKLCVALALEFCFNFLPLAKQLLSMIACEKLIRNRKVWMHFNSNEPEGKLITSMQIETSGC